MSLPERAAHDIRRSIEASAYPDGRLPAEPVLAKHLGVSKATVRAAVSILEQEGLLSRRQGSGTFVVQRALGLHNNLTLNFGVTDLIAASGFVAGTTSESVRVTTPDAAAVAALDIGASGEVLVIERTRTSDGKPVARTTDTVALTHFVEKGVSPEQLVALLAQHGSLYEAMSGGGVVIRDGVAEIGPAVADAGLAKELGVKRGTLLVRLDQTDYDIAGSPIVHSIEYFIADAFKFQVFRKGRAASRRPFAPVGAPASRP